MIPLLLIPSLLSLSCVLDPTDCRHFEPCELWTPSGMDCGLVYDPGAGALTARHPGGSCGADGVWRDPAFLDVNTEATNETGADAPCPANFARSTTSDHEGDDSTWASCAAGGSGPEVGRRVHDLPEGAACGLSKINAPKLCDDRRPLLDEPPTGMALDWVPDRWLDRVDEACDSSEDGASLWLFEPAVFFRAEDGCQGDDCLDASLAAGFLCGLHARDLSGAIEDRGALLDALIDGCPDAVLLEHLPALRAAAERTPTCAGRPVDEGCPDALALTCTGDQHGSSETGIYDGQALCWCAAPEAAQGTD